MIKEKVRELLGEREFVSVATADLAGRPNAAPKFLLKVEGDHIFLIDYVIGRTWQNLKDNPRASLSFIDINSLVGYQLNCPVQIIESGKEYDSIVDELLKKQVDLSTRRIIEAVGKGKIHENFELSIPDKFVILKMKIEEVVEMGASGALKREK